MMRMVSHIISENKTPAFFLNWYVVNHYIFIFKNVQFTKEIKRKQKCKAILYMEYGRWAFENF